MRSVIKCGLLLWGCSFLFASICSQGAQPSYDYLPANEVTQLDLGEQTSLALVRSWRGHHQYGTAILLADLGQHADPSGVTAYLRRHLNDKGWATISLSAPHAAPTINHKTDAEEINKAGEQQLVLKATQRLPHLSPDEWQNLRQQQNNQFIQIMDRLDALGQPYPGKRMLIATDQSAGLMIQLLYAGTLPKPDLLVLINPYLTPAQDNAHLAEQLAQLAIPVLDILSPDATPNAIATAAERRALSPQNQPLRYQQQPLALNLDQPSAWQNTLALIDGFARRIAKAYP